MEKFEIEIAIIENGTITSWDGDAVQDYVEADSEIEAIELAKDYLHDCIIDNGGDPDEVPIILRAREVIDASYSDYGEWVYGEEVVTCFL